KPARQTWSGRAGDASEQERAPESLPRRLCRPRHDVRRTHRAACLPSVPTRDKVSGRIMTAHVLFSDGTSAELALELDASPEPKVFVLGSPSREVLLSAERGASAAWLALRRRGLLTRAWASFFEMTAPAAHGLTV